MFSSIPNRRLMSNEADAVCGSNVVIENVTPVSPAAGAGGLPMFRSLYGRRRVRLLPLTLIDRQQITAAGILGFRPGQQDDLVGADPVGGEIDRRRGQDPGQTGAEDAVGALRHALPGRGQGDEVAAGFDQDVLVGTVCRRGQCGEVGHGSSNSAAGGMPGGSGWELVGVRLRTIACAQPRKGNDPGSQAPDLRPPVGCCAPVGGFVLEPTMILWERSPRKWLNLEQVRRVKYGRTPVPDTRALAEFVPRPPVFAHTLILEFPEGLSIEVSGLDAVKAVTSLLGIPDPTLSPPHEESPGDAPSRGS